MSYINKIWSYLIQSYGFVLLFCVAPFCVDIFLYQIHHFGGAEYIISGPSMMTRGDFFWAHPVLRALHQVAPGGYVEPLSTVSAGTLVEGRVSGVPAQVELRERAGRRIFRSLCSSCFKDVNFFCGSKNGTRTGWFLGFRRFIDGSSGCFGVKCLGRKELRKATGVSENGGWPKNSWMVYKCL